MMSETAESKALLESIAVKCLLPLLFLGDTICTLLAS